MGSLIQLMKKLVKMCLNHPLSDRIQPSLHGNLNFDHIFLDPGGNEPISNPIPISFVFDCLITLFQLNRFHRDTR